MEEQSISKFSRSDEFFPLGIIPLESATELGQKIDMHLMNWYYIGKFLKSLRAVERFSQRPEN